MRILHVAPCYAPAWAYGGPVQVVTCLTGELARRGHQVTVLTTDGFMARGRCDTPMPAGVHVRRFRVLSQRLARSGRLFVAPGFDREIATAVRRADIVHIHEHRTLQAVSAARACRQAGVPYVLSPHGSLPIVIQRALAKEVFDRLFGARVLAGAARFAAVSHVERQQLRSHGIDDALVREIPNGLDHGFFEPLPPAGQFRSRFGLGDAEVVLFVGRIHAQKKLALLLEAFAGVARERERAMLVIAGPDDGYAGELMVRAHRLGLGPRVRLVGPVYGEEKRRAYVDANVVAYPSAYEIFGLVPLEALACGTRVVVCEGTGCAPIVAEFEAGSIVRPDDPERLAGAMTEILNAPAPSPWLLQQRDRVRERYSWSTIAAQAESLYAGCQQLPRSAERRGSSMSVAHRTRTL
jgi:glycosyltransferase involved in cell wall biosynthesis